ncbi:hypothetical protein OROHE_009780 [Orobanche hederae]
MRCVFSDPKEAPPPLKRLSPDAVASYMWKGYGSFVEELIECMTLHTEDVASNDRDEASEIFIMVISSCLLNCTSACAEMSFAATVLIEMVLYDMELAYGDNDIQELSGSKYQAISNAIPLVFHEYLNRPGDSYFTRTTYDDNAITNAVEIYASDSGAVHFIASNNDCGVGDFDMEHQ